MRHCDAIGKNETQQHHCRVCSTGRKRTMDRRKLPTVKHAQNKSQKSLTQPQGSLLNRQDHVACMHKTRAAMVSTAWSCGVEHSVFPKWPWNDIICTACTVAVWYCHCWYQISSMSLEGHASKAMWPGLLKATTSVLKIFTSTVLGVQHNHNNIGSEPPSARIWQTKDRGDASTSTTGHCCSCCCCCWRQPAAMATGPKGNLAPRTI